jgi:hypothetical protein
VERAVFVRGAGAHPDDRQRRYGPICSLKIVAQAVKPAEPGFLSAFVPRIPSRESLSRDIHCRVRGRPTASSAPRLPGGHGTVHHRASLRHLDGPVPRRRPAKRIAVIPAGLTRLARHSVTPDLHLLRQHRRRAP